MNSRRAISACVTVRLATVVLVARRIGGSSQLAPIGSPWLSGLGVTLNFLRPYPAFLSALLLIASSRARKKDHAFGSCCRREDSGKAKPGCYVHGFSEEQEKGENLLLS